MTQEEYLQYSFGGWLKENAGTIGSVLGAGIGTIIAPGIGTSIGAQLGGGLGNLGGSIGSNPEEEAALEQQKQAAIQQSLQASQTANTMYAMGGQISEFEGPKHEQGGLPLTQNAEVEGGETKGTMSTEKFVFSDRLKPKGSKKTFANLSKEIEKKYEGMDNDKYALESKDKELQELATKQESLKRERFLKSLQKLQQENPEMFAQMMQARQQKQAQNRVNMQQGMQQAGVNPEQQQMIQQQMQQNQAQSAPMMQAPQQMAEGGTIPPDDDEKNKKKKQTYTDKKAYLRAKRALEGRWYANRAKFVSDELRKKGLDYTGLSYLDPNMVDSLGKVYEEQNPLDFSTIEYIEPTSKIKFSGGGPVDPPWLKKDFYNPVYQPEPDFTTIPPENQQVSNPIYNTETINTNIQAPPSGPEQVFTDDQIESVNQQNIGASKYAINKMREMGYKKKDINPLDENYSKFYQEYTAQNPLPFLGQGTTSAQGNWEIANNYGNNTNNTEQISNNIQDNNTGIANNQWEQSLPAGATIEKDGILVVKQEDGTFLPLDDGQQLKGKTATQVSANPNAGTVTSEQYNTLYGMRGNNYALPELSMSGNSINYNVKPNPNNWNEYYNKDKSFTPDNTYKYLTENLGIDPERARVLVDDPRLMQGYFEYIKGDEELYNRRKEINPNLKKSEAFGNKNRYGQHHQWMLESDKLNEYLDNALVQDMQGKKASLPNTSPEIDINAIAPQPPTQPTGDVPNLQGEPVKPGGTLKPFVGDWLTSGLSTLPNIGQGIANAFLAKKIKYDRVRPEQMSVDYVDPTRAIQEVRDSYAGTKDTISQVSTGSGNLMSNLIGASASQSGKEASVISQYDNTNAGIYNNKERYNAGLRQQANNTNARIQMQELQDRIGMQQDAVSSIAQGLNTGMINYINSKRDADMMNIAGGPNYYYRRQGPSWNQTPTRVTEDFGFKTYIDKDGTTKYVDPLTGKTLTYEEAMALREKNKKKSSKKE